jgi:hypothetical protein
MIPKDGEALQLSALMTAQAVSPGWTLVIL